MKTRTTCIRIFIITVALAAFLSGCDFSKIKVGEVRLMYGESSDSQMSYTFKTFTGSESERVEAQPGETIGFEYDVVVDKGSLVIEWQDPDGEVVWQKSLSENGRGSEGFVAASAGKYALIVQGKGAAGSFDVSWAVK